MFSSLTDNFVPTLETTRNQSSQRLAFKLFLSPQTLQKGGQGHDQLLLSGLLAHLKLERMKRISTQSRLRNPSFQVV